MATVSLLGTQTLNTTSGTHTVVATPAVGDLIVIVRANTGNTTSTAPTDTGTGGTYSLVAGALKATSADLMQVWVRNSPITAASSTTFSDAAGASTGGGLAVFKVTGMDRYGPDAIRQSATQANQAAAGTPTPVFGSAALTGNAVIGAVFNATSAATLTPRTGYTEAFDVGYSTPTTGLEAMFRSSGETGTSIAWGSTSASAFSSIAVELDATAHSWTAVALADDFTGGTIDAVKWTSFNDAGVVIGQSGGTLNITTSTTSGNYGGIVSNSTLDHTGKFSYVQLPVAGNFATVPSLDVGLKLQIDNANALLMIRGANNLVLKKQVASAFTNLFSTAYSSTNHAWFAIGESNGVTYFLNSTNGIAWNVTFTVLNPIAVTALLPVMDGGIDAVETSTTTYSFDNFNTAPSGTAYTQSLTASLTPSGAFSKLTSRSFTASMLSTGTLAKKAIRSFTASMLSTGTLVKKTIRSFTASLGLSGILTKSRLNTVLFGSSLGLSGSLSRSTNKSLIGSLPLSGILSRKTFRSFTASLTPSGVLTSLKAFTRALTASMTPSGVLSKRTNKPFTASLGLSGVVSRVATLKRSLTASLTPTGVLNKKTLRNLTASMTPHGVVTSLKLFVRSLTASMTPSGTLSKQTRRSFTASLSLSGLLQGFLPPKFVFINRILNTFRSDTEEDAAASSATLDSQNQIAEVNSSATIGEATSSSPAGTPQSENSSGTVETTNTNETLD